MHRRSCRWLIPAGILLVAATGCTRDPSAIDLPTTAASRALATATSGVPSWLSDDADYPELRASAIATLRAMDGGVAMAETVESAAGASGSTTASPASQVTYVVVPGAASPAADITVASQSQTDPVLIWGYLKGTAYSTLDRDADAALLKASGHPDAEWVTATSAYPPTAKVKAAYAQLFREAQPDALFSALVPFTPAGQALVPTEVAGASSGDLSVETAGNGERRYTLRATSTSGRITVTYVVNDAGLLDTSVTVVTPVSGSVATTTRTVQDFGLAALSDLQQSEPPSGTTTVSIETLLGLGVVGPTPLR